MPSKTISINRAPEERLTVSGALHTQSGSAVLMLLSHQSPPAPQEPIKSRSSSREILAWTDLHHKRTGQWPKMDSGPIVDAPSETWAGIEAALDQGSRGLAGGSSLAKLLARYRRVRNKADLPPLNRSSILEWAESNYRRSGRWLSADSGPILDAPGET
jgi:hypothetical protein